MATYKQNHQTQTQTAKPQLLHLQSPQLVQTLLMMTSNIKNKKYYHIGQNQQIYNNGILKENRI